MFLYSRTASITFGVQINNMRSVTATKLAAVGNAAICSPIIYNQQTNLSLSRARTHTHTHTIQKYTHTLAEKALYIFRGQAVLYCRYKTFLFSFW